MQTNFINRQNKLPLYQQLYEIVREGILCGEYKVGDMIPPESLLISQYGVSRTTVRQVLDLLVQEGLIYRQAGRGSFVAEPTLEQGLQRILSFTEDMQQRGLIPSTTVINSNILHASEDIAANLLVSPGEELAHLERQRMANGEPLSVEDTYLIHKFCHGILRHDYAVKPLRKTLEQEYGIRLVRAKQVIRAIVATPSLARWLAIPLMTPVLFIERLSFSQQNIPIEFLRIYYRADRYSLYNELHD